MPGPVLERTVAEKRGGRQGAVCSPEVLFGEGRAGWDPLTVPPAFCPGPGILNNHSHTLPANGEMNGGPSSQSMVSGSHCTPPPPYHADPSLVRYVGCCWVLPQTQ